METSKYKKVPINQVAHDMGMTPQHKSENVSHYTCFNGHDDKSPSLALYSDSNQFHCFGCREHGDSINLVQKIRDVDFKEACQFLDKFSPNMTVAIDDKIRASKKLLNSGFALEFHHNLSEDDRAFLLGKKGLSDETINKFQIGKYKARYSIPVYDEKGFLVNIRLYSPDDSESKFINYEKGCGTQLYGIDSLSNTEEIIYCEGEFDRLILEQNGFRAITGTGGAGTFRDEWIPNFKNKSVYLCLDNDEPGRQGAQKAAEKLIGTAKKVFIVDLSKQVGEKGDVSDLFMNETGAYDVFYELLTEAAEFISDKSKLSTGVDEWIRPLDVILEEEDNELEWIIPDLVPQIGIVILSSKPKIGKTLFSFNIAKEVASGGTFLNRQCRQGKVFIIQLEDSLPLMKKRLKQMDPDNKQNILIKSGKFQIDNNEEHEELVRYIIKHRPLVVIIDPFVFSHNEEDENDSSKMSKIMKLYRDIALEHEVCLMLVHHDRKSGGSGGDNIRGSGAIFSSCDIAMSLSHYEGKKLKLETVSRMGNVEPLILSLNTDVLSMTSDGEIKESKMAIDSRRLYEYLKANPEGRQRKDAMDELKWGVEHLDKAVGLLKAQKLLIEVDGIAEKGRPPKLLKALDLINEEK